MKDAKVLSNDVVVAGLYYFIAVAASILYLLEGDIGSFLAQSKSVKRSNVKSLYYLHTKANIPQALDDIERIHVVTKDLIKKGDYPERVKSDWLKFVLFFEGVLKGIGSHTVRSSREHYVNSARSLLDVVDCLQELMVSFSTSVELVAVKQKQEEGLAELDRFEKIFATAHKLAEDSGFVAGPTE
jgi:hypothetical protein